MDILFWGGALKKKVHVANAIYQAPLIGIVCSDVVLCGVSLQARLSSAI